jgi:hypothetical protein
MSVLVSCRHPTGGRDALTTAMRKAPARKFLTVQGLEGVLILDRNHCF